LIFLSSKNERELPRLLFLKFFYDVHSLNVSSWSFSIEDLLL
jgi:hypothetical protein